MSKNVVKKGVEKRRRIGKHVEFIIKYNIINTLYFM